MYTIEQATEKMQRFVDNYNFNWELNHDENPDIIIYDKATEDYGFCWVFFWQVKNVKDDHSNVIIGNGPMLLEKATLDMFMLGTGEEIDLQIAQFQKNRDIFLQIEEDEHGNFEAINV